MSGRFYFVFVLIFVSNLNTVENAAVNFLNTERKAFGFTHSTANSTLLKDRLMKPTNYLAKAFKVYNFYRLELKRIFNYVCNVIGFEVSKQFLSAKKKIESREI